MTKSKSTKRALFASLMSLVICCAMLIGSTFAWFTDSVTTGKNKIVAGNLDVELYSKDANDEYVPVGADDSLFNDEALWEPGYTEVVYLKVANLGTLALKYKLAVTVDSETSGTNVNGEVFKLSDYLVFGQATGTTETVYATREAAQQAAGSTMGLNDYANESALTPGVSEYVALVVYMPTTVGNEANYKTGTDAPTIDLGITLVATQTPYESDSFDNKYDENAPLDFVPVSDGAALNTALNNGGTVVLTGDTTAESYTDPDEGTYTYINVYSESTIDLNGYSLESEWINIFEDVTIENGTLAVDTNTLWTDSATVTLKNVTLTSDDGEIVFCGNYSGDESYVLDNVTTSEDIIANGAALTINSGAYSGNVSGADTINGGAFSGDISVTNTVTINDGEITGTVTTDGNGWNLVINEGEFVKDSLIDTQNDGSGSITINGGTFSCTSIRESSTSKSWGSLTVTGGTFTEDMIINTTYASVINISGGDFKSLSLTGIAYSPITISGGTFGSFSAGENVTEKLTVTGGTFGTDPSDYVKDGYTAVSNDDDTWTVTAA